MKSHLNSKNTCNVVLEKIAKKLQLIASPLLNTNFSQLQTTDSKS